MAWMALCDEEYITDTEFFFFYIARGMNTLKTCLRISFLMTMCGRYWPTLHVTNNTGLRHENHSSRIHIGMHSSTYLFATYRLNISLDSMSFDACSTAG